jgi:Cof subfamily protein (haloacid dehalogenase superfamily)
MTDLDIRLIAIDLDGTLLNDSKQVTDNTIKSLATAVKRGVKVVIASARPPRSVRGFYQQLGLDTWQINYNGAMIWDEPAKRVVFHQPMNGDAVLRLIRRSRELHADLIVQCEIIDRWHTDRDDKRFTTGTGKLFEPDQLAAVETICREPITMLNLLGDPAAINRIEPILMDEFASEIELIRAGDNDLLIGKHCDACKSNALKTVAEHYRVPMSQVMAIGDAPNDVGMLQLAAVSVAMDNAHPRVKEVADWVAPSNNDHGVCAALEQFVLQ